MSADFCVSFFCGIKMITFPDHPWKQGCHNFDIYDIKKEKVAAALIRLLGRVANLLA